jgi:acyl-CoA dehydrogenase
VYNHQSTKNNNNRGHMSQELDLFKQSLHRFLDQEVAPSYLDWEQQGIIPRQLWRTLGKAGFLCVDMPIEYGGCGGDLNMSAMVIEVLSQRGFAALATNVSVHSDIVAPYISHLGNEAQKKQWLPLLALGEAVGAIAMTEPGAGSDLQAMRCKAIKTDEGYLVSGQKTFITNGQHADVCIVAAKTDPNAGAKGISLFLLEKASQGYDIGSNLKKIGQHCGDTSELFFSDVLVKEPLGQLHKGFAHLMNELPRERLILAVGAIAACSGMLDMTVEYTKQRQLFGQSLSQLQNTRFVLAHLDTQMSIHQAFILHCIALYEEDGLSAVMASKAKLSSTELQCKVADDCLQLFGGYGYMEEYPIARAFLDARVQRIYGGASEVMKEIIARDLLGK